MTRTLGHQLAAGHACFIARPLARHAAAVPGSRPLRAPHPARRRRQRAAARALKSDRPVNPLASVDEELSVQRRSEVEAPFRALRLVFCAFFAASASVGAIIALTQVVAALGQGERAAVPLADAATSLGVDLAAVALFAFFFRGDWQARGRQIARMTREERLGGLPLQLANGQRVPLTELRTFARPVLVAGTREQVEAALAAAEPFKDKLLERSVMVVPLPIYGDEGAGGAAPGGGANGAQERRWLGQPLQMARWRGWFEEQAGAAGKSGTKGLYVSLRMDGRVRGSGTGSPPWARIAATLPPTSGVFKGFLDGLDGRV